MAAAEEASSALATAKVIVSATASFTATLLLARSVTRDLIPDDIQDNFTWAFRKFCSRYFSSKLTIVIQEYEGLEPNKLYEAANNYLATKISPSTTRIRVSRHEKEARHNFFLEPQEEILDVFDGVDVKWELVVRTVESNLHSFGDRRFGKSETRNFELTFHRKHKDTIIDQYLPYIEERAKELRQEKKTLKLFTLSMDFYDLSEIWTSVNLDHPSTFDTLAMDTELKEAVLEDLKRFVRRKDYYRRVGKAWKRGYLLYGPPGTGKSSLIAAMANYLKFDVYDLELTDMERNLELRKALVATANRSILVIEDIDCTIDLSDRNAPEEETTEPHKSQEKKQVTLSGLLNFVDGLWSSVGDERIIIFTTNHKEKLDPALLRPGRMDMHVHMSYCTPSGFRLLASNYLGVKEHPLFGEIEGLIRETEVTPAEVAEELMKSDDPDKALYDVVELLRAKREERKKEKEEEKVKMVENEEKVKKGKDDAPAVKN